MSILIKGMEMPKDGFITVTITSDGRVVGNYKRERDKFEYLDNKDIATAVPVPPHGRLVDADALDADLERQDMHTGEWDAVGFSIEEIENAPTIIPAEEGEK